MKKQILRIYIWVTLLIISIGLIINSIVLFQRGNESYLSWSIWGSIILCVSIQSLIYTHLYIFIIFDRKIYLESQIIYLRKRRIVFLITSNFLNLIISLLLSCMYFSPNWWSGLEKIKINIYSYVFLIVFTLMINIYISIVIFKKYNAKLKASKK